MRRGIGARWKASGGGGARARAKKTRTQRGSAPKSPSREVWLAPGLHTPPSRGRGGALQDLCCYTHARGACRAGGRRRQLSAHALFPLTISLHPHVAADELQGESGQGQGGAAATGLDPLTPAFLLQLIKLLRRKQTLLDKAKQHNDAMTVSAMLD